MCIIHMAFDYFVFNRILSLIENEVNNGKIVKISQISNEEFLFVIRNNNQNQNSKEQSTGRRRQ